MVAETLEVRFWEGMGAISGWNLYYSQQLSCVVRGLTAFPIGCDDSLNLTREVVMAMTHSIWPRNALNQ